MTLPKYRELTMKERINLFNEIKKGFTFHLKDGRRILINRKDVLIQGKKLIIGPKWEIEV